MEKRYVLDSTVVFNEVMYNPAGGDETLEWFELHNQMAVDVDISGWKVDGGVEFDFAEGTTIEGGDYLVVAKDPVALEAATGYADALGPFSGNLSNSGERLELFTHSVSTVTRPGSNFIGVTPLTNTQSGRRLMSGLQYDDENGWPIAADGSGASLAKFDQEGGADVSNWRHSLTTGGTPGERNFAIELPPDNSITTLTDSSASGNDATTANLSLTQGDSGYEGEAGVFNGSTSFAQSPIDINPAVLPQATIGAWVQATSIGSPARHEIISSDNGGFDRAITIDSRSGGGETGVARYGAFGGASTGLVVGPTASTNDGWTFIAAAFDATGGQTTVYVDDQVTVGNATHNNSQSFLRIGNHPFNIEYFNGLIDNAFVFDGLLTAQQIDDVRNGGADAIKLVNGPSLLALYEFEAPIVPPPPTPEDVPGLALNEVAPGGTGFSVELLSTDDETLQLENYVLRSSNENNPDYVFGNQEIAPGEYVVLDATTLGYTPAPGERLFLYATNADLILDAARVTTDALGRSPDGDGNWQVSLATLGLPNVADVETDLVINEIMYHAYPVRTDGVPYATNDLEWIEIHNRSATDAVNLSNWTIDGGIRFDFPTGRTIPAGGFLVVTNNATALQSQYPGIAGDIIGNYQGGLGNGGDLIQLIQPNGNTADEVRYFDNGNWPTAADGGGSSLELRDANSDNSSSIAWSASDESQQLAWQTYSYRGTAVDDGLGRDLFHEFVLGMLDAGEVLLDDIAVIEDPDGTAVSLLPNGDFEADQVGQSPANWLLIGTHGDHGDSLVAVDPDDANNKVLHLKTTGPTEDKHNQASSTFANGQQIDIGTEYEISFRARWLSGSNQLNTRLYFNFLQETTLLDTPSQAGTPAAVNSQAEANTGPTYSELEHSPVVPTAAEAVTVTIAADDPTGIATVTLHYSVNETAFQTVSMTATGDTYTAEIPAQGSGDIVQFYVSGEDSLGASSVFPRGGVDSRALYQVADGRQSLGQLHNVRIVMLPSETNFMYDAVNRLSNHRHGGTVVYDETSATYDVGVRLKGSAFGRNHGSTSGLSLQFPPDQLFRGVHETVSIERSGDRRELLAKHLLNRASDELFTQYDDVAHIITPRGQETGTALLAMSRTSDVYLESVFGDGASQSSVYNFELLYTPINTIDGNPASPKLTFPYSHDRGHPDLEDLGNDPEAYRWNFQLRGGRSADNYEPLVELAQALSLTGESLEEAVDDIIDVDQWMRTVAMLSINGNDDVYTRLHMHNFRMYLRPEDQKIIAIPWDLDRAFQLSTSAHPWTQLDSNGDDNNLRKVVERPIFNRLFWGHVLDIANTTANSSYLQTWASHYSSLTGNSYSSRVNYVDNRVAFLLNQIPAEIDFEITTNNGNNIDTTDPFVILQGNGWVDVREVRLTGSADPLPIEWLDDQHWQVTLPLELGANAISLQAFNHQGLLVGADSIQVTTTATNPLVGALQVSELMYHPVAPEDGQYESSDMEFIELTNVSDFPIQLSGSQIVAGVEFTFGDWLLQPDEFVVVVSNQAAFESLYGVGLPVAGEFVAGKLSNGGEEIQIIDSIGATLVRFTYGDDGGWPGRADGSGSSLEVADSQIDLSDGDAWRSSSEYGGSPGVAGLGPINDIVVNEVLTHTDLPDVDSIEIYNTTDSPIDIGGWFVSDTSGDYRKYRIPDNTVLNGDSYLILTEADFNPTLGAAATDFALNGAHGDDVWLLSAEADGTLTRFMDHVEFGAAANGEAIGRWPNGTGRMIPMETPTFGGFNSGPRVGPVVISEIMYNPADPDGIGGIQPADLEFVEILNNSGATIDLTNWSLDDGIEFAFPDGQMLADDAFLVVVGFDTNNATLLQQFRTHYGIDNSVDIVGGFSGNLSNGGERLQLFRPDSPPLDEPEFIPMLLEDEVNYGDSAPWPVEPDAGLDSLTRQQNLEWGDAPGSWLSLPPTPGSDLSGPPRVLSFSLNAGEIDPADLIRGPQPTSWAEQRSTINSIEIRLTDSVSVNEADIVLTNLGVNAPIDNDFIVDANSYQTTSERNVIRLEFENHSLANGVYQLELLSTLQSVSGFAIDGNGDGTGGDTYRVAGDDVNRFYVLGAEWSGDEGISVFDFSTFSYWFGSATDVAPRYVDTNNDDGVSVFDFTLFSQNFGLGITYPTALAALNSPNQTAVNEDTPLDAETDDWDVALMEVLLDWNA